MLLIRFNNTDTTILFQRLLQSVWWRDKLHMHLGNCKIWRSGVRDEIVVRRRWLAEEAFAGLFSRFASPCQDQQAVR